jgi:hypothetical protein
VQKLLHNGAPPSDDVVKQETSWIINGSSMVWEFLFFIGWMKKLWN